MAARHLGRSLGLCRTETHGGQRKVWTTGIALVVDRKLSGNFLQESRAFIRFPQYCPSSDALPGFGQPGLFRDVRNGSLVRSSQREVLNDVACQPCRIV